MKRPVFAFYTGLTIYSKSMVQQITRSRNIEEVYIYFKTKIDSYFINKIYGKNQLIKFYTLLVFEDELKDNFQKFKIHYNKLYNEYFENNFEKKDKLISLLKFEGFNVEL